MARSTNLSSCTAADLCAIFIELVDGLELVRRLRRVRQKFLLNASATTKKERERKLYKLLNRLPLFYFLRIFILFFFLNINIYRIIEKKLFVTIYAFILVAVE